MFLKIQNLHWVEVACQLFIIPGASAATEASCVKHGKDRGVMDDEGPGGVSDVWAGSMAAGIFFRMKANWAGVNMPAGSDVPAEPGGIPDNAGETAAVLESPGADADAVVGPGSRGGPTSGKAAAGSARLGIS